MSKTKQKTSTINIVIITATISFSVKKKQQQRICFQKWNDAEIAFACAPVNLFDASWCIFI